MGASLLDRLRSARAAVLANVGLVVTGSVLALASLIDSVTGVLIVVIGLVGIGISSLGYRSEDDE